jgi:hypothetical protein
VLILDYTNKCMCAYIYAHTFICLIHLSEVSETFLLDFLGSGYCMIYLLFSNFYSLIYLFILGRLEYTEKDMFLSFLADQLYM